MLNDFEFVIIQESMKEKNILVACSDLDYMLVNKVLCREYVLERFLEDGVVPDLSDVVKYDLVMLDLAFLNAWNYKIQDIIIRLPGSVPVTVLTTDPYNSFKVNLLAAGCCDFYLKPIRRQELLSFVGKWIPQHD